MEAIIECRGLTKRYRPMYCALDHLDLTLAPGEIIGLLGPNGSGKTTLIKMINDLLVPSEGSVLIDGMAPGVDTKKIISYLPERSYLNPAMKIRDIISFFADFYDNFSVETAHQMLSDLGISTDDRIRSLSKGTMEKVQLALVMSRRAKLYILDEPMGGIDPAARDYILRMILNNFSEQSTILLSTHLITDIENILDRVLFLKQGRLVLNESVDQIRMERRQSVDTLFREVFRC